MKKLLYITLILLGITTTGHAQELLDGAAQVSDIVIAKQKGTNTINFSFKITVDSKVLKSNKEYHFVPVIQGKNAQLRLPATILTGRKRQIFRDRNPQYFSSEVDATIIPRERKNDEQVINYSTSFPFEQWMQGAQLVMEEDLCGCAGKLLAQASKDMNKFFISPEFIVPFLVYVEPEIEDIKMRSVSNTAYIDFPINKTTIYLDYRNNPIELAKVSGAIDKVVYDPDIRITDVELKGHASPDGPYSENDRLSKLRTEALKTYLLSLKIPGLTSENIDATHVAENWNGLVTILKASNFSFKNEVLDIISSESDLDLREAKIRKLDNGSVYNTLAKEVFPALRNTDFKVAYSVRKFTPDEANVMIWTQPQKLSLQEIYTVTKFYSWDNIKYKEIFEIGVRMYPEDYVSNINACTNALLIKDIERAQIYLDRIDPEMRDGIYYNNAGTLLLLKGQYEEALEMYQRAEDLGSTEATKNMGLLNQAIF